MTSSASPCRPSLDCKAGEQADFTFSIHPHMLRHSTAQHGVLLGE